MGDQKTFLAHEISKYSCLLHQKGFVANHDGNISVKFENTLLATPTAVSKGNVVPEIIITLDENGKKISGAGNPFSEIQLHLAAYRARPDVYAVVHAHPPFATARGLVNAPIYPALPEAIVTLSDYIPVADFAMPGDEKNNAIIANLLKTANVFMLPGNGVLAVGTSIEQAYLRLELVEHLSKIEFYAKQMGSPMTLSNDQIEKLVAKHKSAGLYPPHSSENNSTPKEDPLKELIKLEIEKIFKE